MAIQTLPSGGGTTLTANYSVRGKYHDIYDEAMEMVRFYDQFSTRADELSGPEAGAWMGTTENFSFLSDMAPGESAVSQVSDFTPQALVDATVAVTPTSRVDGIQWAEAVDIYAYTNYGAAAHNRVGKGAMESQELLAMAAALQGSMAIQGAARASLDHDTSTHLFTDAALWKSASRVKSLKCMPFMKNGRPQWICAGHTDLQYDLIENNNVLLVAEYQDKEILFNGETGQIADFKILFSPWAKRFGGAGNDGDSDVNTTTSAALARLATSMTVAAGTNLVANQILTIGTEETGNTHYATNEIVVTKSDYTPASTTVTFVGEGANGGLRFAHASGVGVRNADIVYPVVYGSDSSLVKLFSRQIGPFAILRGPFETGNAKQFRTLAYLWHGNYGRITESHIIRGEYACSLQA